MVILGWVINTVRLTVLLPSNKFVAWERDLKEMIGSGGTTVKELELTVRRLNHALFLVPLSRHFLNGLHSKTLNRTRARKHQSIRFSHEDLEDLKLWSIFLQRASEGISMNLLTLRIPTWLAWSDSCPFGLGGYTLGGKAWRIRIPPE